jgi:protein gp37
METTIEWTSRPIPDGRVPGYTFNIVWGCTKVSEGCKHCYADTLATRYGYSLWGPGSQRRTFGPSYWSQPLRWNQEAERSRQRRSVFCSSMADAFEDHPVVAQERQKLWLLIRRTPWLDWLLLTKRPQNVLRMASYGYWKWPENVWIGTSVENQRRADERIPYLLDVPVSVHFLSCEPLLGPLDLTCYLPYLPRNGWVIVGGESGAHARPMNPYWVRDLRDQCVNASVPFFFKQWGGRYHSSGGRLLDGRTWDELPVSS